MGAVFMHPRQCSFCGDETLDYVAATAACICRPCAARTVSVLDRLRQNRIEAKRRTDMLDPDWIPV